MDLSKHKTLAEAAKDLRKSPITLRRWIASGCPALPTGASYLVNLDEVAEWLFAQRRAKDRPRNDEASQAVVRLAHDLTSHDPEELARAIRRCVREAATAQGMPLSPKDLRDLVSQVWDREAKRVQEAIDALCAEEVTS